ncbi:MAG: response regulator transcription factor [Gemmatimonadetes bacterium]|nr:response regulator transcription factor [Gemmatimonadota bacterium]
MTQRDNEPQRGRALTVFVVDDSSLVRERLVRMITGLDNVTVVGHADTAAGAIWRIVDQKPDVVTLDLRLSASSGFEVLRAIGRLSQKPRVAVVTNYADAQTRRQCLELGADFFFDKSHELAGLQDALERLALAARGNPLASDVMEEDGR